MNSSPYVPDRIISIPWLVFHYEGVSLSQMIYVPSAYEQARDDHTCLVPDQSPFKVFVSQMWQLWDKTTKTDKVVRKDKTGTKERMERLDAHKFSTNSEQVPPMGESDGMIVRPSVSKRIILGLLTPSPFGSNYEKIQFYTK